jgi:hypothetical protein
MITLKVQPSLLEYSIESLNKKISIVKNNPEFLNLSRQSIIHLHLDLVMKYFARERSVLASLSLESLVAGLFANFHNERLSLSVHCMGLSDDLQEFYKYLATLKLPENWSILVYLPVNYATSWQDLFSKSKIKIGAWFDMNELVNFQIQENIDDYLLLTVKAGKAGQVKTRKADKLAREIVEKYPNKNFLLDGGWKLGSKGLDNCQMVSYGSFWSKLLV